VRFIGYYRIDLREIPRRYEGQRLIEVLRESDMLLRTEVERLAHFFKREFSYDALQFDKTDKSPYTAYLFPNEENHYPHVWVGACCFRTREYSDLGQKVEALQWIWIHPYYRNKGMLKEWWSTLRQNHKDFIVEPPLSPSMKQFLLKYNRDSAFPCNYDGTEPSLKKMKAQLARNEKVS
jgi:hypothetical protein